MKSWKKEIDELIDQIPTPPTERSMLIGMYLFHHNSIERTITNLIERICPQLKLYLVRKNRMGFDDRALILRSLIDPDESLKLFGLLNQINKLRNNLAHKNPDHLEIDLSGLEGTAKESMYREIPKFSTARSVGLARACDIAHMASRMLQSMAAVELVGRNHDEALKVHLATSAISTNAVLQRVHFLFLRLQTGKSGQELGQFDQQ